jgi:pyruvate/2-oxoglutarate dehydrogenase complex dihydrolipoamide dehydrogenase (E3) component
MENVDLIIIGSGQGGVPLAADLAREGQRVLLFERGRFGGSCINYGCTPSKAMLASAHGAGRARRLGPLGVTATLAIDFAAVMHRVRSIRDDFETKTHARLTDAGVRIVRAAATFSGERIVSGGGVTATAPRIVIDTGTRAFVPPIVGLAGTPHLTNETFFDQRERPSRMLVLGGGYIGLELGQGMARLGSDVHVIDGNERILAREEADATAALQTSLLRDGLHLHLGRTVAAVKYGPQFDLTLDDGSVLTGDALLVATGRAPNTEKLNVTASRIELDKHGYIVTDEHLRTTCDGVYALGDVAGQPQFTHVSWEDYRRLRTIFAGGERTKDDRVLGYTTFTEPQLARVGLDMSQARARKIDVREVSLPITSIARAIEWGEDLGFYRLLVDRDDRIIGATLVGYEAGEIVHVILAHMEAGSTWQVLDRSMHIHPTYAEGLPSLARLLEPSASATAR